MTNTKHLVGFSGGVDSQACARWVLNRYPKEDVILMNSDAGGNEHPMTTEFIRQYAKTVHPVVMVEPIVADLEGIGTVGGEAKKRRGEFTDADLLTFDRLAYIKQRFPSRRAQFCTYHLKIVPQKRWINEHIPDAEIIRYSGVRRDESVKRMNQPIEAWDEYFDCTLRCPIADWTKAMCFDYIKAHGEEYNQLYTLGFNRVGCAPCINSGKDDILAWADRAPEMIDKVRDWEASVGRTFFAPMVPGKVINWIDEVVEWSRTTRGGKQYGLHVVYDRPACESKYGLCE